METYACNKFSKIQLAPRRDSVYKGLALLVAIDSAFFRLWMQGWAGTVISGINDAVY